MIYSLDMFVHFIKFEKANYEYNLSGFVRYYFIFHQFLGYFFASVLIAGLLGLTKK